MTDKEVRRILTDQCETAIELLAKYVEEGGDIRVASSIAKRHIKDILKGKILFEPNSTFKQQ